MRIFLLTALSIGFLLSAQAQEKTTAEPMPNCRYEINQVDKFTDDIMRLTQSAKIWKGFYEEEFIECAAVRENDNRGLLFAYYAHEEYLVEKGDSLMLLLDNNEILILQAQKNRLAERYSDKIYFANVFYPLDDKQIEILAANKIKAVRQYYKTGFFERDLKERKQKAVKDLLVCIQ